MNPDTDEFRRLDEQAFGARVELHRRELHVHCSACSDRSRRPRTSSKRRSCVRGAGARPTRAGRLFARGCTGSRRTPPSTRWTNGRGSPSAGGEIAWLQPYPDELLEQLPDRREGPEDVALAKETVELAFIAAIQHLAPLPRAVLVLRDVLGCSAKETARLLETTEASVNSALHRARGGLRRSLPEDREAWQHTAEATAAERELLARYVECSERVDTDGLAALLHSGVRFSMPPYPGVWTGRSTVMPGWTEGGFGSDTFGSVRCMITYANGQPAVAGYVRYPGDAEDEPLALEGLQVRGGAVAEIVTFDHAVFPHFDLPAILDSTAGR